MHWFWRSLITWIIGVTCAFFGFLVYGEAVTDIIIRHLFDRNHPYDSPLVMSILIVFTNWSLPAIISMGVYHWLTAPRWESDYTRCGRCGYILRGLQIPRCPECGVAI